MDTDEYNQVRTDEEYTTAWAEEIERRIGEIDEGRVKLIPWEEVLREMRERLDRHSSC